MAKHQATRRATEVVCSAWLGGVLLVSGAPSRAEAQVVQNCQPDQFVDRTAAQADRELAWDFSISTDPERCLQITTGQKVVWNGSFDVHPLAGSGGDNPNPISLHQNGSVTFNAVGTFGFMCLAHSPMKGAIKVVQAATAVPAQPHWMTISAAALLLGGGTLLLRKQRLRRTTLEPSQ